jgi:hypothetical protein
MAAAANDAYLLLVQPKRIPEQAEWPIPDVIPRHILETPCAETVLRSAPAYKHTRTLFYYLFNFFSQYKALAALCAALMRMMDKNAVTTVCPNPTCCKLKLEHAGYRITVQLTVSPTSTEEFWLHCCNQECILAFASELRMLKGEYFTTVGPSTAQCFIDNILSAIDVDVGALNMEIE